MPPETIPPPVPFPPPAPIPPPVTAEDVELLRLLAAGLALESVARRLATSERTVRRRTRLICDRIGVAAPIQAVVWAVRRGLI